MRSSQLESETIMYSFEMHDSIDKNMNCLDYTWIVVSSLLFRSIPWPHTWVRFGPTAHQRLEQQCRNG